MPPNCPWGTSVPLPQISRRLGELLCLSHTARGCVPPPHPVPSWAASGTQDLCRGWGGMWGGGLQPFGVSFVPSLCSCAWICAWSQDVWVLSEQLTLASAASLCLSFPPASRGRVGLPAGVWGLRLVPRDGASPGRGQAEQ